MNEFDAKKSAEARDAAIAAVDEAASEHWKTEAFKAVCAVAQMRSNNFAATGVPRDRMFTTDPVWKILDNAGVPPPREPRAMGAVMKKAMSLKICRKTNMTHKSERVACHRRDLSVYESLVVAAPVQVAAQVPRP